MAIQPGINETFGALFIGAVISFALSGVVATQSYTYFRDICAKDAWSTKAMVGIIWILDTFHEVLIIIAMEHYVVADWGNYAEVDNLSWSIALTIAVTGVITFIVHSSFAHRLYILNARRLWPAAVIELLAVVRVGSAIATTIEMLRIGTFSGFVGQYKWLFIFGLSLSSFIDILITSSLWYFLEKNRTGVSHVDSAFDAILVYVVEHGVLTSTLSSVVSIASLICAALMPHNFIFIALHFVICKLYAVSLLTMLNSRPSRQPGSGSTILSSDKGQRRRTARISMPPSPFRPGKHNRSPTTNQKLSGEIFAVHVNVERTIHIDDDLELGSNNGHGSEESVFDEHRKKMAYAQ